MLSKILHSLEFKTCHFLEDDTPTFFLRYIRSKEFIGGLIYLCLTFYIIEAVGTIENQVWHLERINVFKIFYMNLMVTCVMGGLLRNNQRVIFSYSLNQFPKNDNSILGRIYGPGAMVKAYKEGKWHLGFAMMKWFAPLLILPIIVTLPIALFDFEHFSLLFSSYILFGVIASFLLGSYWARDLRKKLLHVDSI